MNNNQVDITRRDFLKLSSLFAAILATPASIIRVAEVGCKKIVNAWFPTNNSEFLYAIDHAGSGEIIWIDPIVPKTFTAPSRVIRNPIVIENDCVLRGCHIVLDKERNPNQMPAISVKGSGNALIENIIDTNQQIISGIEGL